jgi:hypothetical protein
MSYGEWLSLKYDIGKGNVSLELSPSEGRDGLDNQKSP